MFDILTILKEDGTLENKFDIQKLNAFLTRVQLDSILEAGRKGELELRATDTEVQWRRLGETNWQGLVPLSDLRGEKGDSIVGEKGEKGEDGRDGRDGIDGKDGKDGEKGEKGDKFTFEDLTQAQKDELRGEKGDPLRFEDLTKAQKEELKGEKGDSLTFNDLTADQKKELRGPRGYSGGIGQPGLSAYQVAQVTNGFKGTVQEWLKSLEGKSAYKLWLEEHGWTEDDKTIRDFLNSLKGSGGGGGGGGVTDYNDLTNLPDLTKYALKNQTFTKDEVTQLVNSHVPDLTAVERRISALEAKPDKDTIYNDTALRTELQSLKTQLEQLKNSQSTYDDSQLKAKIQDLENRVTTLVNKPGTPGPAGKDGRDIQLRVRFGNIQWRYNATGEGWNNLIEIAELKGANGANGKNGVDGKSTRVFTSTYKFNQGDIDTYSEQGYIGDWNVNENTTDTKVGDVVFISVQNTAKNVTSFILTTVQQILSTTSLKLVSHGVIESGANGIGGSAPSQYVHNQEAAAATWQINHDMGKYPSVTIVDSAFTEVEGEVQHINQNKLQVKFTVPFSGKAILN